MRLAQRLGVELSWQGFGGDGLYDVILNPRWKEEVGRAEALKADYRLFGNTPTQSKRDRELERSLRDSLGQSLPEYMAPATILVLEALPLTPNGKLDRRALPIPEGRGLWRQRYEAPKGETETELAQIWAELLKLERVGRHDNFFELGGHSLLAVTSHRADAARGDARPTCGRCSPRRRCGRWPRRSRQEATQRSKAPPNLIPAGCQSDHARDAAAGRADAGGDRRHRRPVSPGGAANVQDIYPLAAAAGRHSLPSPDDCAREMPICCRACWPSTRASGWTDFCSALQAVIARHDILRTAVVWEGLPEPVQVVWREAPLTVGGGGARSGARARRRGNCARASIRGTTGSTCDRRR